MQEHAERLLPAEAILFLQHFRQCFTRAAWRGRVQLKAVSFNIRLNAVLLQCHYQLTLAHAAEQTNNIRSDINFHG